MAADPAEVEALTAKLAAAEGKIAAEEEACRALAARVSELEAAALATAPTGESAAPAVCCWRCKRLDNRCGTPGCECHTGGGEKPPASDPASLKHYIHGVFGDCDRDFAGCPHRPNDKCEFCGLGGQFIHLKASPTHRVVHAHMACALTAAGEEIGLNESAWLGS